MTKEVDSILSKLTVRLRDVNSQVLIGSGILYTKELLKSKIYLFTAAHVFFEDVENFKNPMEKVLIDIYNPKNQSYQTIEHTIDYQLISSDYNRDIGVLVLRRTDVEEITGTLPLIEAIAERGSVTSFVAKGFPQATQGKEIVSINPIWKQHMTEANKFQLQLNEEYTGWAIGGFSGSGLFLRDTDEVYLFGIFTRYREQEKGKVIYAQYLETINEVLELNYLPPLSFTFFGAYGLTPKFFKEHINIAVDNLGPRFDKKLNFRLPIAQAFNDLAKDVFFKQRVQRAVDKWLTKRLYAFHGENQEAIQDIEADYQKARQDVLRWFNEINWAADQSIEFNSHLEQLNSLQVRCDAKAHELFEMQWQKERNEIEQRRSVDYRPPYENEIFRVREIRSHNNEFLLRIAEVHLSLSNHPYLLIQGEAGCGKSHLLGDIATERIKFGHPTLLLLGQHFRSGQNVWQNILSQLSLRCTKDELLQSLNQIGKQTKNRILILIDALNEGGGKELWPNELAGFIRELSNYPFIGLALTVRSTYYSVIVPESIQKNNEVTQITHEGFSGNEYAALSLFAQYFRLEQPNFPILAPEFSNPLFLRLICKGIKDAGLRTFPQGFQGVSTIFGYYLNAVINQLTKKREEYRRREQPIKTAILEIAKACFEQGTTRTLTLSAAQDLFDKKFPSFRFLFDDLLLENVLVQNIRHDYKTEKDVEVVFFGYERFGDFYMASELLTPYTDSYSAKRAFEKENELGKLGEEAHWNNRGVLEAMAVILPEKYGLEIFEVYDWLFNEKYEDLMFNADEWLSHFLVDSLKWRKIDSINIDKLAGFINSDRFNIDDDRWFHTLVELAVIKEHPFNSDQLHHILGAFSMPERDAFWQRYLRYYSREDNEGGAYPMRRLIDWAWLPGISESIDEETARLSGQTLAWALASTYTELRDQATKAMVNLLEEQPEALIKILQAFQKVNDFYILERLYGIAYGCALRTTQGTSLNKIAQAVFEMVFQDGNPPAHVLLRDYAKNTVEYALYKNLQVNGDLKLIQPPYSSPMPINIPSEVELQVFKMDDNDSNFKKDFGYYNNKIIHEVLDWDFGRDEVEPAFNYFSSTSFREEEVYQRFVDSLDEKKKTLIQHYRLFSNFKKRLEAKKPYHFRASKKVDRKEIIASNEKHLAFLSNKLKEKLNDEEHQYFTNHILPFIEKSHQQKRNFRREFDTDCIKRWIVQKVFELGYDSKKHGDFDSTIRNDTLNRGRARTIAEKYQYIALHQIIGVVADNYQIKEENYAEDVKYRFYPGPWIGHVRDVDPAFTMKKRDRYPGDDDEDSQSQSQNWWVSEQYLHWSIDPSTWVGLTRDLPNPVNIIQRTDDEKQTWLYLSTRIRWREPKPIGTEAYAKSWKEITYRLQSQLLHKKDKDSVIHFLDQQNFWGRRMPETHRVDLSQFNRENFWAEITKENEKEEWKLLPGSGSEVMVTTTEAVGELSDDNSGAHFRYDMPCKLLFEGLRLHYAKSDGDFVDENGEVIVINRGENGLLIKKDVLLRFLDDQELSIVWTLWGEKNALDGGFVPGRDSYFKVINGVYYLHDGNVTGSLRLSNRE